MPCVTSGHRNCIRDCGCSKLQAAASKTLGPFESLDHGLWCLQNELQRIHIGALEADLRNDDPHYWQVADGKLELDTDTFEQLKPGLSSFADDPAAGAKSLDPLLTVALSTVPEELQVGTNYYAPVFIPHPAALHFGCFCFDMPGREAVASSDRPHAVLVCILLYLPVVRSNISRSHGMQMVTFQSRINVGFVSGMRASSHSS